MDIILLMVCEEVSSLLLLHRSDDFEALLCVEETGIN